MRRLSNAPVGALAIAVAVAIAVLLAACPAAGGNGAAAGPSSYTCANGIAVDGTTDASTDAGRIRCQSCNLLYKLNGSAGALGTSCELVALGEAARIGTVAHFGVGETGPTGLAALGTTLYMVGWGNDALYTLNITSGDGTPDGTAIQVGSSTTFGVGEGSPTGLAAIGDILYMVGAATDRLYTLNIDPNDAIADGSADQVGSLAAGFGVGENSPFGLATIGDTLYMVGLGADVLYTLNITSGDGTPDGTAIQVGSLAAGFRVDEINPTGLATIGDILYMVGWRNGVLYTLDTTDGRATRVGSVAAGFGVGEGSPTGTAAIGTTLYMVGQDTDALYALRYQ